MKKILSIIFLCFLTCSIFAQEALKSTEEDYYDFLSLTGQAQRPTLGYRTLSDSVWELEDDEHIWCGNNLGTTNIIWKNSNAADNWFANGLFQGVKYKIFGPEWFNSYNTAAPYGQNDGALWQGKGYNTSLTAGLRLEGYGLEAIFKPQISFSENREFEILPSTYDNQYGYFRGGGIDAPQRFGNSSFWNFDWGDSEIRLNWYKFTFGFGTQSPWIGPANFNPILHSNNAASYPKLDIGLKKTEIIIPYINFSIGNIETRLWVGYLTESDYFDNNSENNHNMINGFYFSYQPFFCDGLTVGATKVCLSKWQKDDNFINYFNPFYNKNSGVGTDTGEDQKASIFIEWISKEIGFDIYSEIGIDDYLQGGIVYGLQRYPFDSIVYTAGIKKAISFNNSDLKMELLLEISNMEQPRNRLAANTDYTFNFHYQITQGYTNKGQYLGTHLANGGNSQLLCVKLYYPKGSSSFIIQRENPDNTYSFINHAGNHTYKSFTNYNLFTQYYIQKYLLFNSSFTLNYIINPKYFIIENDKKTYSGYKCNFSITIGVKLII